MRYKLPGKSGLRVSELCLGTITFGEDWGWGAPKDTRRQCHGCSSAQIALAWIRAQSSQMIPILGASKLEQLQDNLKCLEVSLSPEQLQKLDRVSQIELGFPHDFLGSEMIHDRLFGGTYDSIDHR